MTIIQPKAKTKNDLHLEASVRIQTRMKDFESFINFKVFLSPDDR